MICRVKCDRGTEASPLMADLRERSDDAVAELMYLTTAPLPPISPAPNLIEIIMEYSLVALRMSSETVSVTRESQTANETILLLLDSGHYDVVVFSNETWLSTPEAEELSFANLVSPVSSGTALSGGTFTTNPSYVHAAGRSLTIISEIKATNGTVYECAL